MFFFVIADAVKKWDSKATDHVIYKAVGDHLKHAPGPQFPGRSGGGGHTVWNAKWFRIRLVFTAVWLLKRRFHNAARR